jgi:CIC family chloride channel protein
MEKETGTWQDRIRSFWLYPRWQKRRRNFNTRPGLLLIAALVGVLGGLGAVAFKDLSNRFTDLIIGSEPSFLEACLRLPWYMRLLIPTAGGLFAGLVLYLLPREGKGHGISEIMEAVSIRGGVLSFRVAMIRSLSSLMSIGTGASIGREGPIVQIAAMFGSKLGQYLKVSKENISILVGCGVASGLAAAYNVPIAASFFVMEIIIGNFAIEIFAPLVVSSVVSTLVYRKIFGNDPVYGTPHFTLISEWELIAYIVLGLLAGIAAAMFRESLRISEREFGRIKAPLYVKSMLGGLLIGIIGLGFPHVWGNGFNAINSILKNQMGFNLMFILFYLKIFATSGSVGSGASGGVFTPTQFVGASLGGFIGFVAHEAFPNHVAFSSAYALVGMGCLMAGTTYAPIMSILMIFEMTLDYEIILPLMLSCIVSSMVARQFHRDSIYTEKLRRKGIRTDLTLEENAMRSIKVEDIMRREVPSISGKKHLNDVLTHFLKSRSNLLYVTDDDRKLLGSVDLHDLKEFFNEKDLHSLVIAQDVATPITAVYPEQSLIDVMDTLYLTDDDQIPVVVSQKNPRFLGVITRRDIIGAYNREVLKKKILRAKFVTRKKEKEGVDYVEMPAGYRLGRIHVPEELENRTLGEVNFRSKYHFQVLAVLRSSDDGTSVRMIAEPGLKLNPGDELIVIGTEEDFEKFQGKGSRTD